MSKKLNILLIEDCEKDAELAKRNLARFAVTHAQTLKAGLLALSNFGFDVVLLDLNLINGRRDRVIHDVADKRGNAATVILTGDINPSTRDHMLRCGADGFMVKGKDDASREDMEWVIYRAIEHRQGKT